jgi:hypothetical protein
MEVVMKTIIPLLIATLLCLPVFSQTVISPGPVNGTWAQDGTPYLVEGEIIIENGDSLKIEPGVRVEFQGRFKFIVQGQIIAVGTEDENIVFTAANTSAGWKSFRFVDTPQSNDTSRFTWCVFEYGMVNDTFPENCGGAMAVRHFSKIVIDHCLFQYNKAPKEIPTSGYPGGGAIALWTSNPIIRNSEFHNNVSQYAGAISCYIESSPLIENNIFTWNRATLWWGGAINCFDKCNPVIKGNTFSFNMAAGDEGGVGGAICMYDSCYPVIDHNLFYNNNAKIDGGAFEIMYYSEPVISFNTIVNNHADEHGGAFDISGESKPIISNTIIWGNTSLAGSQVCIWDDTCAPSFQYCDIQGGLLAFAGITSNLTYDSCIDADPLLNDNYCLTEGSPCINRGDPAILDPDGTRSDIGAYYFDQTITLETPEAYEATNVNNSGFTGNWSSCTGATKYLLDVAYDEAFTEFVGEFKDFAIGNTSCDINGIEADACYYRVRAANEDSISSYSNVVFVQLLWIKQPQVSGNRLQVKVYPNPCSKAALLRYQLPVTSHASRVTSIDLYQISGKKIKTIINDIKTPGEHTVELDVSSLPAGLYFIRLQSGEEIAFRKVLVIQ